MLSNVVFPIIYKKYNISCVFFDKNYKIVEYTNNLDDFVCGEQNLDIGMDIRSAFWEFVGFEEKLESLYSQKKPYVHIPMLLRKEMFYDVHVETCYIKSKEKLYIAMFTRHSKFSMDYFSAIQKVNHETLGFEKKKESMKDNEENYNLINQKLISFHIDTQGFITKVNEACCNFFTLSQDEILRHHFSDFFFSREINSSSKEVSPILRAVNPDGIDVFFHADIIYSNENNLSDKIVICQDVTYLKRVESELEFAVNHDSLTGLPNRNMLAKKLANCISLKAKENEVTFGLCFIDLDKFKAINDNFGHHVGDMYLKHVGDTLSKTLREGDLIARVGGDEFVIILKCENEIDNFESTIQRLKKVSQNSPFSYNEEIVLPIEFSVGLGIYPQHGENAEDLLAYADEQMYLNKKSKRS